MSNFERALKYVVSKLEGKGIKWVLIGPVNMHIQGIDSNVKSIDICSSKYGAYEISRLFNKRLSKDFTLVIKRKKDYELTYYYSEFKVYNTIVKVFGDVRVNGVPVYNINFKTIVCFVYKDMILPLLSLDEEERAKLRLKVQGTRFELA